MNEVESFVCSGSLAIAFPSGSTKVMAGSMLVYMTVLMGVTMIAADSATTDAGAVSNVEVAVVEDASIVAEATEEEFAKDGKLVNN
jgi:hypothetical protein